MIGIGWTEMLVIGVVALIFIGPKELPALMQRVGKAVGAIRRMGQEFQREINRSTGLDTVADLRKSITDPLKKTTAEITREFNKIAPSGQAVPSGAIKPADPKAESIVKEIEAKAGMTPKPGAAMVPAPPAAPAVPPPEPAKPAVKAPRKRAAKAVESPAPIEALAPAIATPPKPRRRAAPRSKPAAPVEPPTDNG